MAVRPDNLTTLVFAAIRDKIVDATLAPGSSVSEASLAKQLEVSKTPVREALLRLRHVGLVEPTPRGLRVIQPSVKGIRDAFEFRAGLEAMAGRYAANRSTEEEYENIYRLAEESLAAANEGRDADFHRSDREFHAAIAQAARNERLIEAVGDSFVLTLALRQRDVKVERDFIPDAHEHVKIAEGIRAGDAELASSRLAGHNQRIMAQLLEAHPHGAVGDNAEM
ncbi:GntR family transcriptional regulator [Rhodococcus sp. KBS0724]|nr:GntR family transcriptional regulator [Rhodococcus sp. KBS0724]